MHILMVTLGFYPAAAWGGPVKVVYQNSKELIRRGHQVTVYCTNLLDKRHTIRPHSFEEEYEGIRVVYFKTWNIPAWPGTLGPIWLPGLGAALNKEIHTFDVVHIHGYRNFMSLPVIQTARQAGVPIVIQPHGGISVVINSTAVKKLYDRTFGRFEISNLDALIALQESERQQALDLGVPAERIVVIPVGVEISDRDRSFERGSFRLRYGIPEAYPMVLFLARINRKKGTDILIEAFAKMNGTEARLVIAGPDDGQLKEVQQLVKKYRLEEKVFFTGLLTGQEVMAAFRDADLFVHPCRTDTFPSTMMEACLAETPMVVTDGCEIAHLVKDRVAEVVPPDPLAIANGMKKLLTDRGKYDTYRANTRLVVEDTFSLQASCLQLEALYSRLIHNHGTTGRLV